MFKKSKYFTVRPETKREIPEGLWIKCQCGAILFAKDLERNLKVCQKCAHHFRLTARERIRITLDTEDFEELDAGLAPRDLLGFPGYAERLAANQKQTGLNEAAISAEGTIGGHRVVLVVMDSHFIMGSMGTVVGEKVARAAEHAVRNRLPLIVFSASGGARMQEGILSLMQMAKTAAAIGRLDSAGLLYVSVLTDPTMGGVSASFAFLGDIILAEPGALIGFAGPRVIEQTIRQKLPDGFQQAEFLQEHGFVDAVVPRSRLKDTLIKIIGMHQAG
ncbi:acetyl-CoA carboxylase, carboxyltransferase subunit beta [Candidatus Desulforudis audaxviator]|uniref:Acetyl-coenzyme A carboxylase carboxyl transferase subunit beta n=1 Tax=Desulforudis audaxviator (strain MP104C) TaxID=477974 RepID=ACCD_DESAP|nr:acetyl-CoA carboxylase, carboxyltransferase subunit beta [Candidatus Desulforudis audaxviator]B1I3G7.1 RecName: Full=Acetyl-coenzyme A carboxylase carboxyl transferase subunit beta; Short=ACCase subunit beta; Short=Acetyl-CoA carboxylase carboxyltransferase subunit beta [Candidatus Desulforudis audaxviator MP104C]ACA59565.1 acetyl-CoA carboxylase, carboxyl transferase, beta subunit [Candidatus Desulforudis audaxviator MP104C]AZK59549.1 Acetyl-coenzyme A carboxyl transferase beta chain [Candid